MDSDETSPRRLSLRLSSHLHIEPDEELAERRDQLHALFDQIDALCHQADGRLQQEELAAVFGARVCDLLGDLVAADQLDNLTRSDWFEICDKVSRKSHTYNRVEFETHILQPLVNAIEDERRRQAGEPTGADRERMRRQLESDLETIAQHRCHRCDANIQITVPPKHCPSVRKQQPAVQSTSGLQRQGTVPIDVWLAEMRGSGS